MDSIRIVVDLQYGSTGKGLIVGYLAEREKPDTIMTAWAPNAGHTYIDSSGRKFIHTHLGNGIVSPYLQRIMIGPGSLINPDQLMAEIRECEDLMQGIEIMIHPHAAIVTQKHIEEEAGPMTKIGSTKKGVGAAMINRIRRNPDDANIAANYAGDLGGCVVSAKDYRKALEKAKIVLVEGAQGYGLSMYHGFYPYTTSRDVSTWQILADVGIPYEMTFSDLGLSVVSVVGTCRTYPIRVANRYSEDGKMVGWSGPHYTDQKEISFEDIGQKTELTTVTKLPRRIFTFSGQQIEEAINYNGTRSVFLNFINYVQKEKDLVDIVKSIERGKAAVTWVGSGPTFDDVHMVGYGSTGERLARIIDIWKECRNVAG